jgi:small subunit ribosomal protein S13
MPRIAGIDIPEQKRIEASLRYVYGIGRSNVKNILKEANIDLNTRAKDLTGEEIARIQRTVDKINTEGNLRKQVRENIERLKRISSYRGMRHSMNLPCRGQRTRTNARTKRGKRKTIGALKKEAMAKVEESKKE